MATIFDMELNDEDNVNTGSHNNECGDGFQALDSIEWTADCDIEVN